MYLFTQAVTLAARILTRCHSGDRNIEIRLTDAVISHNPIRDAAY
jgi:hypothetical protein